MARIPYPDLTQAEERVRTLAAAMPPLNIFRMLPHAPAFLRGFGQLGAAILSRAALDARLRELIILRVGRRSPAPYEWQQHVPIGRACGMSDEEIAALERDDAAAPCFDERDRVVLRLTDELLAGPRASDGTLSAMRGHFSDRELCEAVLTIGFYMMVARFLETTGVDLETAEADPAAVMKHVRRA
ncbi:MAG: carboxymuconolactone decarboxylase family protein [Deltaproteobacteria bacterium]|nr:carboxymuconolactone decarboxylase family protein [Deltaproteobacteria bacterium]